MLVSELDLKSHNLLTLFIKELQSVVQKEMCTEKLIKMDLKPLQNFHEPLSVLLYYISVVIACNK